MEKYILYLYIFIALQPYSLTALLILQSYSLIQLTYNVIMISIIINSVIIV